MHEFSIAINIVDLAIAEAGKANANEIREIEIEIGKASAVVREALEFALESAVIGTVLKNAIIIIHETPAIAQCNTCKLTFEIEGNVGECPSCGDITANLISGSELKVKSITIN